MPGALPDYASSSPSRHQASINQVSTCGEVSEVPAQLRRHRQARPVFHLAAFTATVLILINSGCGGGETGEIALDPLQLIENVETNVTRHHPTRYTEIEVGEFYITLPIPDSIEIYRINMKLYFVTSKSASDEITKLVESNNSLIRDRIISTFQQLTDQNLHDPDLLWLKTELVSQLRSDLETTEIRDVIFPEITIERG